MSNQIWHLLRSHVLIGPLLSATLMCKTWSAPAITHFQIL